MRMLATVGVLLAAAASLPAPAADDRDALAGVKELKAVFDIREGDGKALLNRLTLIDETRASLIAQGVKPRLVLTFRGPAARAQDAIPAVKVVGNTWISQMAYQARGYAFITP